jgi:predicted RecA/RadA family phage recombinase
VAISGFEAPATLQALTDKTVEMQKKVAGFYKSPLKITSGKTSILNQSELLAIDKNELSILWNRSPYQITRNTDELSFMCDYNGTPEIAVGTTKEIKICIGNKTDKEKLVSLSLKDVPAGYTVNGMPDGLFKIKANSTYDLTLGLKASPDAKNAKIIAEISDSGKTLDMQLGLVRIDGNKSAVSDK